MVNASYQSFILPCTMGYTFEEIKKLSVKADKPRRRREAEVAGKIDLAGVAQ